MTRTHPPDDELVLVALGEPVEAAAHVNGCTPCGTEVEALRRVVDIARSADDSALGAPSDQGWTEIDAHRRWSSKARLRPLLAVAASVVVIAAAAAVGIGRAGDSSELPMAVAELEALAEVRPAHVRMLRSAEGIVLELDMALPPTDGYYELWLIDDAVTGMVSLGPVPPDGSRVLLPDGLDVSGFPIIDVSAEHFDGDPTHSGDSVLRGRLDQI
jgi:anti-sigma-K factor RskA